MKKTFYTEAAYFFGVIILAIGTAFMERANFGMSMVVAPAYVLHLKISEYFRFFTFGMAEYVFQATLLIVLSLVLRRWKRAYLFSFVTAVLYGLCLDGAIWLVAWISYGGMVFRVIYYAGGMLLCCISIALLFRTYISPEAYEIFVKELSEKCGMPLIRFKTIYDCGSCVLAIVLSFVFFGFGEFQGIGWGTIVCAVFNGWVIGRSAAVLEHFFEFRDGLPGRRFFEK